MNRQNWFREIFQQWRQIYNYGSGSDILTRGGEIFGVSDTDLKPVSFIVKDRISNRYVHPLCRTKKTRLNTPGEDVLPQQQQFPKTWDILRFKEEDQLLEIEKESNNIRVKPDYTRKKEIRMTSVYNID